MAEQLNQFANFSTYTHNAGGSPFGAVGAGPIVVFQAGSEADILSSANFQANGRMYANPSSARAIRRDRCKRDR